MHTSIRRAAVSLLVVALAVVGAVVVPPGGAEPAGAQAPAFYTPPSPLPAGRPGDIIKSERITYANGTGTRVMYLSRTKDDAPIAVTGTVIVPNAAWTGGGARPIVAYAPFTSGLGDQCAISHALAGEPADTFSGSQRDFVNALLAKGIAVAQTDYQGLGTPGDHTYMMRLPQAHATLDVIRAAQRLPGTGLPANGPVGIAGYSQGGAASGAAVELAPTYAPELDLRGAYVGAPASDLGALATSLDGSFYAGFLAYALVGFDAAYTEIDMNALANAEGRRILAEAKTTCTLTAVLGYGGRQTSTLTADGRPVRDYLPTEPFRSIVAQNKVGTIRPTVPVLVEHSSLDDVLPQAAQGRQLARDWCARGAQVQFNDLFTFIPIFTHLMMLGTAGQNAANWLDARFRGTPATTNCSSI